MLQTSRVDLGLCCEAHDRGKAWLSADSIFFSHFRKSLLTYDFHIFTKATFIFVEECPLPHLLLSVQQSWSLLRFIRYQLMECQEESVQDSGLARERPFYTRRVGK